MKHKVKKKYGPRFLLALSCGQGTLGGKCFWRKDLRSTSMWCTVWIGSVFFTSRFPNQIIEFLIVTSLLLNLSVVIGGKTRALGINSCGQESGCWRGTRREGACALESHVLQHGCSGHFKGLWQVWRELEVGEKA